MAWRNVLGVVLVLIVVASTLYMAHAQGLINLPEIPVPWKRNVRFDVTIQTTGFAAYWYISKVEVETTQVGMFSIAPTKFAWICVPGITPPAELKVELTVPAANYRATKTLQTCGAEKLYASFIVGFDKPGTYSYTIRILRDSSVEYEKTSTVVVV